MAVRAPALRAVGAMVIVGLTVKVVVTDAVPAVTVIVCGPAGMKVLPAI